MALPDGLYDLLLTEGLTCSLLAIDPSLSDVQTPKGSAAEFLTDVVTRQLGAILEDFTGDDTDRSQYQLELVNELLVMLRQRLAGGDRPAPFYTSAEDVDLVASPLRILKGIQRDRQFQLFVRSRKGSPYRACGRVTLESADGDRPMSIFWKLERPLPARLFREFSMLRGM